MSPGPEKWPLPTETLAQGIAATTFGTVAILVTGVVILFVLHYRFGWFR